MQDQEPEDQQKTDDKSPDTTTDPVSLLIYGNLLIRDIGTRKTIVNKRF